MQTTNQPLLPVQMTRKSDPVSIHPEDRDRLLRLSEISIWVDTYDDIFSDFDSRTYAHRSISDDFLAEVKKLSKENRRGRLELKILIPAQAQNLRAEMVVRSRLHHYFQEQTRGMEARIRKLKLRGVRMMVTGVTCMIVASYLSYLKPDPFWVHAIIVLFEPVGWFSVWNGSDVFMYQIDELKPDLQFFKKMGKSSIKFMTY